MTSPRWPFLYALLALPLLVGPAAAQVLTRRSGDTADFRAVRPTERIARAIDDGVTVARSGNRHPLARAEFDAGPAPADTRMDRMTLVLQPDAAQQQALEALLAAQQDPQSPEYHRWLTPEDFGQRFGAAQRDIERVVAWLESHGFQVEPVAASGRQIVFSGTAAQVQGAFHTEVHFYDFNGQRHYANATDPRIPEALAEVVGGVVSLHDFHSAPMHHVHAAALATPQYTSGGSHYMSPADFATIYDVAGLYSQAIDGSGQSIAVAGRSNLKLTDVQAFRGTFGLAANNPTVILNGPDPGIVSTDEQGEATLDVEWAGAVAKNASVQFVVSASTNSSDGVALSSQYIVNHNLAPVMSLSFGACEAVMGTSGNQFWNTLWQQAAAQGITVLVASGDSGAAGCDSPTSSSATGGAGVSGLCSPPYSTCVGGTQFADTSNPSAYWSASNAGNFASALSYIPEAAWNSSGPGLGLWAGGGGASQVYTKPSWQSGPGVPADGHRDVPDVSLNSSTHDGYLVALNGQFYVFGGTSASTPSLAGLMALVAQRSAARLGNANPVLYALAAKQANAGAAVFHDTTAGNNSVPGQTGFTAGAGYDLATGLGSVDTLQLVNHWSDSTVPTPALQLSESGGSVSVTQGSSNSVTLTVAVSGGFNSAVAFSTSALPSGLTASFSPASLAAPGSGSSTLKVSAASGVASGTYNLTVTATGGGLSQSAPLSVSVQPNCTYSISPASASVTASAGSYSFNVTTQTGCTWNATTATNWITLGSPTSGNGSGKVNYSVALNNSTSQRTGSIGVAGLSLAVTQAAASAVFSLNPTAASFPSAGGNGSVAISANPSTASWTAASNASWITITSAKAGAGSGPLTYSVGANTSTSTRTGTLTIAGITFTVSQAASASCSYSVSLSPVKSGRNGVTGSIAVTTSAGCHWTAVSNTSWITITSGSSGTGNGTAFYQATSNTTSSSRAGTMTVAGYTITLTEAPGR